MNLSTLDNIRLWFARAVPEPTDKSRAVQLGCHFEEVGEMLTASGDSAEAHEMESIATRYKKYSAGVPLHGVDRAELLDSLADQIVTAVGVAHMFKLDIAGALAEVDRSNWSKFDADGLPTFDSNGKGAAFLVGSFKAYTH